MKISGSISNSLGALGRFGLVWFHHAADLLAFTWRLFSLSVRKPLVGKPLVHRIVVEQIYFTAVQALPIVIPIALLIGAMLIVQFGKVAGQYDLGKITVLILIREVGPLLTAFIVILRSSVAITVEISYMRILNEIEAIELNGIDPMHVLGYPRLVGICTAMLGLFVIFDLSAVFGGYALAWSLTDIKMEELLPQMAKALGGADIAVGIAKALFFGVIITVVSLHRGFTVQKEMTAIPVACSGGAVETLFYILAFNILLSLIFYL